MTQASVVQFGRAYLECAPWANLGDSCPDDFRVELTRIELTVDGKHGYLDPVGMQSIGVGSPGRELHFRGPGYWQPSEDDD